MQKWISIFCLGLFISLTWSCKTKAILETEPAVEPMPMVQGNMSKIDFDVNALNDEGLIGDRSGLVIVNYQFCFVKGVENEKAIRDLDPSISINQTPASGARCRSEEALAQGNTHQANHKQILFSLSNLHYVNKIKRVWFE
jgi:hypothetical protein